MGHKLAMSYPISRTDGTLCRLAEVHEDKDLGVILTKDLLEQAQRATKLVVGLQKLEYADRLHKLELTTYQARHHQVSSIK